MEKMELKVSSKSEPSKVAGAIAEFITTNEILVIKTIGAGAVNQAIKSIAIARSFTIVNGYDIICTPSFYKTEIDGEEISAISLNLKKVVA